MASLTLKDVPDEFLGAVREAAQAERRSVVPGLVSSMRTFFDTVVEAK